MSELVRFPDLSISAFALTWRGRRGLSVNVPDGVTVRDRILPARPLHTVWKRMNVPKIEALIGPADVIHGVNAVLPPSRCAGVVTVHDLAPILHPELVQPDFLPYGELVRRAIDRGAYVHTVSDFVRSEVLEYFSVGPERVVTVPNGIPTRGPATCAARGPGPGDLPSTFVLALGTIQPRKDYVTLLRAFDLLAQRDPEVHLLIGGSRGWGLDAFDQALAATRAKDRVHCLGYVSAGKREHLLAHATVLAYPSLYEGFGLPPLEAMAARVPVVASSAGAIPEVLGGAATLVPVRDHEMLAEALEGVIANPDKRAEMITRGLVRAGMYDWSRTAQGLHDLYFRAAGRDGTPA